MGAGGALLVNARGIPALHLSADYGRRQAEGSLPRNTPERRSSILGREDGELSGGSRVKECRIGRQFSAIQEAYNLNAQILEGGHRFCMECSKSGQKPKPVLPGFGVSVEVRMAATGELVGYLHANCKDEWARKNDKGEFSFRVL